MANDPAPMLDRHRIASLAFAHHGTGDADGLFQIVHLIEAVFGGFTDDAVSVGVHISHPNTDVPSISLTHSADYTSSSSATARAAESMMKR